MALEQEIRLAHLAEVENYLAAGIRHITGQRATIVELERDGYDTSFAKFCWQHSCNRKLSTKETVIG
jgi:hypothetical protein